jgi:hypothetical protein
MPAATINGRGSVAQGFLPVFRAPSIFSEEKTQTRMPVLQQRRSSVSAWIVAACKNHWRKGWDLNPRTAFTVGGFQDRCHQPLGHPSEALFYLIYNRDSHLNDLDDPFREHH